MMKFVDGVFVEMTSEEIAALKEESEAEPTVEERLAALEGQLAALRAERGDA